MGTFSQMLKEARAMRKRAQEELSGITGEDPNSMPGAENDKPVELPKEDPEVNDGSMGPKSTRTTEGKGDDRPITAGDLFEADESIVNPEEKPLETADANAKEASAKKNFANEILSMIHGVQVKKAEDGDEKKDNEESSDEGKESKDDSEECDSDEKSASAGLNLELTKDVLAKLACAMLAEEEGSDLAEKIMAKEAGARQARDVMSYIAGQEKAAEEYIAGQRAAAAYMAKQAQDLGAADADAAIDAMAAASPDEVPVDGALPEEAAADEAAAEEAAAADAGAEGEMLPEDAVAEVLLSQLQSGDLTEEDLGEIVMELAEEDPEVAEELGLDLGVDAGEEAAPAAEGAPAEDGAPVEEVEAEPTDEKAASAKKPAKKTVKVASKVERRAALMNKIAAASKLLVKHLGK